MHAHRHDILGAAVTVDKGKIVALGAIRTAAVVVALVAGAWALGAPQNAIPLGVSALLVGLGEAGLHPGHRWRIMLWATMWMMVTALLGYVVAHNIFVTIIASTAVALAAGWVGIAGPRAALIGLFSLVMFTITAGLPETGKLSLEFVALVGLGGLIQTLVLVSTALIRHPRLLFVPPDAMATLAQRLNAPGDQRQRYFRHALRLALAIAIATTISETTSPLHEYWIPMTVAWIAKPETAGSKVRIAQRVGGTALAVLVMAAWGIWLPKPEWALLLVIGIGAYIAFAFIWANYTIAVFGITVLVLTIFAQAGEIDERSVFFRLAATIIAALIILLTLVIIREPKAPST